MALADASGPFGESPEAKGSPPAVSAGSLSLPKRRTRPEGADVLRQLPVAVLDIAGGANDRLARAVGQLERLGDAEVSAVTEVTVGASICRDPRRRSNRRR